jgi:ribosomal protein L37AE/L43A
MEYTMTLQTTICPHCRSGKIKRKGGFIYNCSVCRKQFLTPLKGIPTTDNTVSPNWTDILINIMKSSQRHHNLKHNLRASLISITLYRCDRMKRERKCRVNCGSTNLRKRKKGGVTYFCYNCVTQMDNPVIRIVICH